MCWEEVQLFDAKEAQKRGYLGIWTRPAERMKAKREHRAPITSAMNELISDTNDQTGFVFKSGKLTTLSDMTLSALMKRIHASDEDGFVDQRSGLPAVPHGLRSTFRDWVAETGQSREAAGFGSQLELSYTTPTRLQIYHKSSKTFWVQFLYWYRSPKLLAFS